MDLLNRINLAPRPALAARIKKVTPWVSGVLFVLGCLVMMFLSWSIEGDNRDLAAEIGKLEADKESVEQQQQLVARLVESNRQLAQQETELRKVVGQLLEIPAQKQYFSKLLLAIGAELPMTVRCEKIDIHTGGGEIAGTATQYRDLPTFVARLEKLSQFSGVTLRVINQQEKKDKGLFDFAVTFSLADKTSELTVVAGQ